MPTKNKAGKYSVDHVATLDKASGCQGKWILFICYSFSG